ncbi:MAG TPA: cytochrome c-type biogenesis protein CcmH [Terracidiphilus sp.]|nr:cytochrome c-type biogenesis protein CcmH [Terracidiphilus sp.]
MNKQRTHLRFGIRAVQALLLAFAVCFSLGATDASARYDHLNHQLMCGCGCGQVLGECNHVGCPQSPVQLAELRTDISGGKTDQEILDGFAAKYGMTVLAAPPAKGFDLVAWIAPVAVFLAALLGTILLIRQWAVGKKDAAAAPVSTPEMDALREKIRRETGSEGGY